ncbi:MAG: hypothetical protein WBM07_09300 [Chitinivibrionales bacterium]
MRFRKDAVTLALVMCAGIVFSQVTAPPGLWMYTDDYGQPLYSGVELVDTSSIASPYTVYFGLAKDSILELRDDALSTDSAILYYFNFPYQFTQGFAGCKMMWEDRDWNWVDSINIGIPPATQMVIADSLVIKYIGPLQNHKVDIYFGEALDRYAPAFIDSIGTLPSNYHGAYSDTAWRTVSIPLPPAPAGADRTKIREVRFLIHNAAGTTALTSDVGHFYIDVVGMVSKISPAAIKAVPRSRLLTNNRLFFSPSTSGNVDLSVFSLIGKLLFTKQVPVMAGKNYSIKQFSWANVNVSGAQVNIVRITGAGVNLREKIR